MCAGRLLRDRTRPSREYAASLSPRRPERLELKYVGTPTTHVPARLNTSATVAVERSGISGGVEADDGAGEPGGASNEMGRRDKCVPSFGDVGSEVPMSGEFGDVVSGVDEE